MIRLRELLVGAGSWAAGRLDAAMVRFVCLAVLVVSAGLLAASFATADRNQTAFGTPLGNDFAGFYAAGTLLNRYPAGELYNQELEDRQWHELLPRLEPDAKLPYVHPPFVAFAFRGFALLPYAGAFALWLVLSAGLYVAGFGLVVRAGDLPADDRTTALLLALSFEPFVMECWLGGQLSAVGFFCLCLACFLDRRGRPVASGAALGLCLYKPTLLVLVLPLLVLGRRWRTLLGFGGCGLVLATGTLLAVGWDACLGFLGAVLGFTRTTTGNSGLELRLWKYVDLNSWLRLLLGGEGRLRWVVLPAAGLVGVAFLFAAWRRAGRGDGAGRQLAWATTLTATLVVNLYVGVYDSLLVVAAAVLAAGALRGDGRLPGGFRAVVVMLYVVPWLAQPVARATGIQLFTLALAVAAGNFGWLVWRPKAGAPAQGQVIASGCRHDHATRAPAFQAV